MTDTQTISDAAAWPRIAADQQQLAAIQRWLLANGIDPYDVLAGGTVAIEDSIGGRRIRYEHLLRDRDGKLVFAPDRNLLTEPRSSALVIGPPDSLLPTPATTPEKPETGPEGDNGQTTTAQESR